MDVPQSAQLMATKGRYLRLAAGRGQGSQRQSYQRSTCEPFLVLLHAGKAKTSTQGERAAEKRIGRGACLAEAAHAVHNHRPRISFPYKQGRRRGGVVFLICGLIRWKQSNILTKDLYSYTPSPRFPPRSTLSVCLSPFPSLSSLSPFAEGPPASLAEECGRGCRHRDLAQVGGHDVGLDDVEGYTRRAGNDRRDEAICDVSAGGSLVCGDGWGCMWWGWGSEEIRWRVLRVGLSCLSACAG